MGNKQSSSSPLPETTSSSSSSFDCVICTESSILYNKKFTNNGCSHPFCMDCISKHIQATVEENRAEIRCPDIECGSLLDPHTCQSMVSPRVFERWCDLLLDHMLLTKMNGKTLYCPYRNCSAHLLLNDDKKQKWCPKTIRSKAECPICKKNICFKCKTPWHAGYRCDEAPTNQDANDVLFGRLADEKNWKRCPTCRLYVERYQGCRYIKCRCGALFCYDCGRLNFITCRHNKCSIILITTIALLLMVFAGLFINSRVKYLPPHFP